MQWCVPLRKEWCCPHLSAGEVEQRGPQWETMAKLETKCRSSETRPAFLCSEYQRSPSPGAWKMMKGAKIIPCPLGFWISLKLCSVQFCSKISGRREHFHCSMCQQSCWKGNTLSPSSRYLELCWRKSQLSLLLFQDMRCPRVCCCLSFYGACSDSEVLI